MKKYLYITIFFFIAGLSACDRLLDITPDNYELTTENYYKTPKQIDNAIRGVYSTLAETFMYGNTMLSRMGLIADEGFMHFPTDNGKMGYFVVNTTDEKILNNWRELYKGINRANLLLKNIDNPELEFEQAERENIKGEALFLRAYYYLLLVNRYGPVPLVLDVAESSDNKYLHIARTPAAKIYEQILSDMTLSADLVSDIKDVKSAGRVSKSAVWGVLSRVCLYMAGNPINKTEMYPIAATWAKKVIDLNFHELNSSYQKVFVNYAKDEYDSKESIWEVEFWGNGTGVYLNTGGAVGINNGILYSAQGKANFGYSQGMLHPNTWLYNLYKSDDLRRDWAIAPYRYLNDAINLWPSNISVIHRCCGKFRRENELVTPKSNFQTPQNFPLLRYSDVLLMYAEALNESEGEPNNLAYEAINQVRRRAVGLPIKNPSAIDLSNLSYSAFKKEVKDERARELCFELLRKSDLVRWGDFYANMKKRLTEIPVGTTSVDVSIFNYYNNVAERDTIWPIPSYEMGVNPKLTQNMGW